MSDENLRGGASAVNSPLTSRGTPRKNEIHGMTATAEYGIWRNIIERCTNPDNPDYQRYGGRGIAVAKEWADSFVAFYEHVGPRHSEKHSIDRRDNSRGYEPGNVRWATRLEQQQNLRSNVFLTHNGETLCLRQWERRTGICHSVIRSRMARGLSSAQVLAIAPKRDVCMKGVYWNKRLAKWQAKVYVKRSPVHLGTFNTCEQARAAVAAWSSAPSKGAAAAS